MVIVEVRRMFEICEVYKKIPKTSLFLTIEDAVVTISNRIKQFECQNNQ